MKAIPYHQKNDVTIRRGLLLALGLLVAVFYAPESNMSSKCTETAPSCVASKAIATLGLQTTEPPVRTGLESNAPQTEPLIHLRNTNATLAVACTSWGERLAAFKTEEQFDYNKTIDYLFGLIIKGFTGVSWAAYETTDLVQPLVLQPLPAGHALHAKQLALALPHQVKSTPVPGQVAISVGNSRGEYIMLPGGE
ncbi:hypothetical protein [Pontibacter akesuensis]|uniref:Uncharacterized protein n=1 Tax=Pontibacter akesuensis TaxID=388950 RepID=A0A1I7GLF6_9BACT|nr:hypothetical protein [Pontibacter akesuensis]SFU49280.1 hypothetical protein SAMN04487941_1110 [Pontibacter akesuensis]